MTQKPCFKTGLTCVRQLSLNNYSPSKFQSSSLVKHRFCLQKYFWSVSFFLIFNQNYEISHGTSYLSLFQSFLIQLCCYPKSFNKMWKHHILALHRNSSSTDGARFFLAVQSLESSVLLDILVLCKATLDDCLSSSICSRIFSLISCILRVASMELKQKFSCFLNLPFYETEAEHVLLCHVLNL